MFNLISSFILGVNFTVTDVKCNLHSCMFYFEIYNNDTSVNKYYVFNKKLANLEIGENYTEMPNFVKKGSTYFQFSDCKTNIYDRWIVILKTKEIKPFSSVIDSIMINFNRERIIRDSQIVVLYKPKFKDRDSIPDKLFCPFLTKIPMDTIYLYKYINKLF